jgi:molecular chaperone GrpE (heat shock protein)
MTEKKLSNKTNKLRNFLVTGSVEERGDEMIEENRYPNDPTATEESQEYCRPLEEEEMVIEDIIEETVVIEPEPEYESFQEPPATDVNTSSLEKEIIELKDMVASLTSELGKYATSKEQLKEYTSIVNKRDAELANRKFLVMLEQLSAMREDFFKLCLGMNAKLDSFSPKDIMGSFEAYGVDMENILVDTGVQIGPTKYERLNTIHQRIVDVIPTDDESMNGMIAERVSEEYQYQGRVLLKEKVKIYKFSEKNRITEGDEKNEQRICDRN